MNQIQFKQVVVNYFNQMIDKWFEGPDIKDKICKAAAKTLLKNNKDKYDSYLNYLCDTNGNICLNDFFDSFIDDFQDYRLDLTEYHIPFLPNKILILSKQDLINLKNLIIKGSEN